MDNPVQERPHYPALDGLRGMAIIMVVLSHLFPYLPLPPWLGAMGVDLFFVLSGFLITDILLKTKANNNYFRAFYQRRVLRIFPLYYLVIGLYFLLRPGNEHLVTGYRYYTDHWPFVWFHLNNILPIIHEKPPAPLLLNHFWSLSLEEQFYLVWPFLVYYIPAGKKLISVIFLIIAAAITSRFVLTQQVNETYLYWYITTNIRVDYLAIGGLLAVFRYLYPEKYVKRFIIFSLVIFGLHLLVFLLKNIFTPVLPHFTVIGYSSYACIGGLLIIYGISRYGRSSFFSNKVLVFFGKISYGLYVFHFPIWVLAQIYCLPLLHKKGLSESGSVILLSLVVTFFSIAVSALSYYQFERRILNARARHSVR